MLYLSNYATFTTDHDVIINYFNNKIIGIILIDPHERMPTFVDIITLLTRAKDNAIKWNEQNKYDNLLPFTFISEEKESVPGFLTRNFEKL